MNINIQQDYLIYKIDSKIVSFQACLDKHLKEINHIIKIEFYSFKGKKLEKCSTKSCHHHQIIIIIIIIQFRNKINMLDISSKIPHKYFHNQNHKCNINDYKVLHKKKEANNTIKIPNLWHY